MNVLFGIAALGLLALPHAAQEAPAQRSEIELAYRSQVGVVSAWRTSMSSDIRFLDTETAKVLETMTMNGGFDSDLTGVAPEAEGETRELLHLRRMEVSIGSGDEEAETMIMTRDSIQNGDEIVHATDGPELDAMLEALFGEPVRSFRLTPRGVEARMSSYGKADEDGELAEMGLGDEFPLLHPVLPEGPVAVGAKWKGLREISSTYDFERAVDAEIEYELVSLAAGIATLRAKGRVEVEGPLKGHSEDVEFVFSKIVFEQESAIRFRVAEGALEAAECSFTFDARILTDDEGAEEVLMKSSSRIALDRRAAVEKTENAK